jgi:gas vesicle protein
MSNSNKISVDKLNSEIMKYLKECKEDIEDDVKEVSSKIIKEVKNELKQISPKAKKTVRLRGGTIVESRELCKIMEY